MTEPVNPENQFRVAHEALRMTTADASATAPERVPDLADLRLVVPATRSLRPGEAREIAAQLVRPNPPIIAITGRRGVGRTTLISEVAAQLRASGHRLPLRAVELDRSSQAFSLLGEAERIATNETPEVVVIDDLDLVASLNAPTPDKALLQVISSVWRTNRFVRFLLVIDSDTLERIDELHPELGHRLHHVPVSELAAPELREIAGRAAQELGDSSGMSIAPEAVDEALRLDDPTGRNSNLSRPSASRAQPGHAISRIDTAIGRARMDRASTVTLQYLREDWRAPAFHEVPSVLDVELHLLAAVRGQDAAVAAVAERCVASLNGLKTRPERPHAVFLFSGPTGTGKTQLAKSLAEAVYGTPDALIRIDMSEYSDRQDALMKLVGGSRIWKNSTTEGLLTTRVIARPRSVILLDEFEKSHPQIWPLFLQIFDDGCLTDGWGNTASFAETIIVMTSNLGATVHSRTMEDVFSPELRGRIDANILFRPLTHRVIDEIAGTELSNVVFRIARLGWQVEYDVSVPKWLADVGRNPELGARDLQHSIERYFLAPLAAFPERQVRVRVRPDGGALVFEQTDTVPDLLGEIS